MGLALISYGAQLFARRGNLPPVPFPATSDHATCPAALQWTTFTMPLRVASTLPRTPLDIARFLATSLTFMRNLVDVSMFFNEHRLVRVTKSAGRPKPLTFFANRLDSQTTASGMMTVQEVQSYGTIYALPAAISSTPTGLTVRFADPGQSPSMGLPDRKLNTACSCPRSRADKTCSRRMLRSAYLLVLHRLVRPRVPTHIASEPLGDGGLLGTSDCVQRQGCDKTRSEIDGGARASNKKEAPVRMLVFSDICRSRVSLG
jgi:hypothetical protein